ncbi:GNAT family N-acetyltransferase [Zavarzinia compransoris]|uniref:GNAT family N-acetyltransferase n=1 Tax=Zavarzinia compransoris TaxID=1264899 RepID=A0A317E1S7_9PROT|nr:GNAT family N-acetyltransferase [Zavarzinia compransoris]PWR20591.1 GNAT family N-acetyltransferase [Zavarzinia compransoris]TDP43763.1 ribosomal protein S18 acetylase RimI-like enzyme [Zavarzinia compransoris]
MEIVPLTADPETLEALAGLLAATVAAGGSVGFMHPLAPGDARAFWEQSFARPARVILGARIDGRLRATLTLDLCPWPNQPHRAELAKMMTAPAARGQGLATALIAAAEGEARRRGRWLLTLDTAAAGGAAGLYEKCGYIPCGRIPDFALKPRGGLTDTLLFYKRLN